MEDPKIKLILGNLGFSDWEITAYLKLVKYGPKTAVELSRLSNIARSKTYEVVTRLRRKGLVMKVPAMPTKGVTQKFVALDPKKVFLSKVNDMEELSKSLGELYKNPITPSFPKINMYTSKEAVKELFYDVAKDSKSFSIYLSDLNLSLVLDYSFEHILNMIKKKRNHFLLRESEELKKFSSKLKNYSFIKCNQNMSYIIASDRIILDLYKTQHVIVEIISDEAVKTFLNLYNNSLKNIVKKNK